MDLKSQQLDLISKKSANISSKKSTKKSAKIEKPVIDVAKIYPVWEEMVCEA